MELHHLTRLLAEDDSDLATMIGLSFFLGQRLGDICQLHADDFVQELTKGILTRLLVTFRRGKVIGRIGPYTISLPRTHTTEPVLNRTMALLSKRRGTFVLSTSNTAAERERLADNANRKLKNTSSQLEVRSVRRGGLTRMATAGVPVSTLLLFSRHASLQMLYRYLDSGRRCREHHLLQDEAQRMAEQYS